MRLALFLALIMTSPAAPAHAAARFGLRLEAATVLADGTAVDVHYVSRCPPGSMARVSVTVAQRTGRHVASGTGSIGIVCSGETRSVLLRIPATQGGFGFRPGRAFALAGLRAATGLGIRAEDDRARLVVLRR